MDLPIPFSFLVVTIILFVLVEKPFLSNCARIQIWYTVSGLTLLIMKEVFVCSTLYVLVFFVYNDDDVDVLSRISYCFTESRLTLGWRHLTSIWVGEIDSAVTSNGFPGSKLRRKEIYKKKIEKKICI